MKIKEGVKINGLKPEILLGIIILEAAFNEHAQEIDFVITEITGGKHGTGSLHYCGQAIDARTHGLTLYQKHDILKAAKFALGENYDLILEAENTANEHFHLEFQPK